MLRIMAVTFAEMGDWEQIEKFFQAHGARFYEYHLRPLSQPVLRA